MIAVTPTEENYIKAIFKLSEKEHKPASTNGLAKQLSTSAAAVTDMLRRLAEKNLIHYQRYKGVTLTVEGNRIATSLIRRHRLWETFLVDKLKFDWHQVHEIAEELEHIQFEELILRLDAFLNYPRFDPHGDPIPNADGKYTLRNQKPLADLAVGSQSSVVGVKDNGAAFLKYLNTLKIKIGTRLQIVQHIAFDKSLKVLVDDKQEVQISDQIAQLLLVRT